MGREMSGRRTRADAADIGQRQGVLGKDVSSPAEAEVCEQTWKLWSELKGQRDSKGGEATGTNCSFKNLETLRKGG